MKTPPMTILRSDYRQIIKSLITQEVIDAVRKKNCEITRATEFCAAKLVQIFERLTIWKQEAYKRFANNCWFWIPIFKPKAKEDDRQTCLEFEKEESLPFQSLYDELQGEHCKDVIRAALFLLENLPILERKRNPHNAQDRTYWYRLKLEKLEVLKAEFAAAQEAAKQSKALREAKSDSPTLQGEIPTLQGEIPTIITKINSKASLTPPLNSITTIAVESENGNVLKQEDRNEQERSCTNPPVETIPVTPGLLVDPQDPGGDKLVPATARNAEMLKTLAETGIEANSTIEKYLRRFRNAPDRISNAIAVVRQQAAKGAMRSAAAVFVDAIQHNRKPNLAVSATPVYPDGDWLTESGRLDQSFILNQAQLWRTGDQPKSVAFSKMAIEETMACVCSHYLNHPAKLAIDWQAYYAKSHRYLENVSLRLEAGATIQEKEQTGVLALLPLLSKAVSQPVYESLPAPMLPAHSSFRLLTGEVSDA